MKVKIYESENIRAYLKTGKGIYFKAKRRDSVLTRGVRDVIIETTGKTASISTPTATLVPSKRIYRRRYEAHFT